VTAWVVVANHAIGGLFAFGAIAVAPFSIGGITFGLLPFGGLALGIMPFGGMALGVLAFGGIVVGWQAVGFYAIAWKAALGGVALAHDFALGGIAHAAQANNDFAKEFIDQNLFFRFAQAVNKHWVWMNFLWIAPLFVEWQIISSHRRRERSNS
jgi:hypothetical protein